MVGVSGSRLLATHTGVGGVGICIYSSSLESYTTYILRFELNFLDVYHLRSIGFPEVRHTPRGACSVVIWRLYGRDVPFPIQPEYPATTFGRRPKEESPRGSHSSRFLHFVCVYMH